MPSHQGHVFLLVFVQADALEHTSSCMKQLFIQFIKYSPF